MFFRVFLAIACLTFTAPAWAQLPQPLEQALDAKPNDRQPTGIVLRMALGSDVVRVAVSFDEEDGPAYRLLEPADEAQLSDTQAEMWAGFNTDEGAAEAEAEDASADAAASNEDGSAQVAFGDYDPEAIRASIGDDVRLVREEAGQLVYEFAPLSLPSQGDSPPEGLMAHMRGQAIVDTQTNQLALVRYTLAESFKPNLAARIERFDLEQRFVFQEELDGPRVAGVSMTMAGSAMFQRFSQTMQFDIEEMRFSPSEAPTLEAGPESP